MLQQINLKKFGFNHIKEEDFRDDGNKFKVYRNEDFPKLRITKLITDADVYLDAYIEESNLTYDEYSNIEGYDHLSEFNGYERALFTEDNLRHWIANIEAYYNDEKDLEAKVTTPFKEEVLKKAEEEKEFSIKEAAEAKELLKTVVDNCTKYTDVELCSLVYSYKELETKAQIKQEDFDKKIEIIMRSRPTIINYLKKEIVHSTTYKSFMEDIKK